MTSLDKASPALKRVLLLDGQRRLRAAQQEQLPVALLRQLESEVVTLRQLLRPDPVDKGGSDA